MRLSSLARFTASGLAAALTFSCVAPGPEWSAGGDGIPGAADGWGDEGAGEETGVDPALADPPEVVVGLAPEFFDYETAFASTGLGVGRSPAGAIYLRATDCDRVADHVAALLELRRRVDPAFVGGAELAPAVPLPDGWCEARLDDVLTAYLAQTFWKTIDDTAVDTNCWGHALRAVEAIPSILAAEAELFTHVISSPQCRQLAVSEEPSPGDIVVIRAAEVEDGTTRFQEFHGAVWVTDELWITKNGAARFDISPSSFVLDVYGRVAGQPDCSERTDDGVSVEHVQRCGQLVQTYRCRSLEAYESAQPGGFPLYDSLISRVGGLLSHRVLMQQEQEVSDDIVAEGTAYVSRHPFSYVEQAYQERGAEMPADVASYLAAASEDRRLRFTYDLSEPALPGLPGPLVAELEGLLGSDWELWRGGGFEAYCSYHAAEHAAAFEAFERAEATLSGGDRSATISLLLQLASSDCRDLDVTERLAAYVGR